MKMRPFPGLFLLPLMIGAILASTYRPSARVHGRTLHIGEVTSGQGANSRSASLEHPEGSRAKVAAEYGTLPLSFEANRGQTDPRVNFISRGSGYTLYLTSTEAVLTLRQPSRSVRPTAGRENPQSSSKRRNIGETQDATLEETKEHVQSPLRMKLVGANLAAGIEGLEPLPGKSNYFIGNEPSKWRTDIPTYAKVRYRDIYPGVDLVYYGKQRRLEYDFIVAAGANPKIIRLAVAGVEKLESDTDGDLVLGTREGEVRLYKPIVHQEAGGIRKEVAGRFVLRGKRQIGFEVAAYDTDKPLIIDPVLSYSTYLGGSGSDIGQAIAVDSAGNAYVTGYTFSPNFPTKNALQPNSGGGQDAFVTKMDPTGSSLVYSAYLGGSGDDDGFGIAVDAASNAYVTGRTSSFNFPTTKAAFQATCAGCSSGHGDAFVTKLNAAGSALLYSTYLGGSNSDNGNGIAVDSTGNAYITGGTSSSNFPTTTAAFQATCTSCSSGSVVGFVTKLDPTGSALAYSTYLGGSGGDFGSGIAVDATGGAYVTGPTSSRDFPIKNALQPNPGGGSEDAFVTKLDPAGSALVYSTYLGGTGSDSGSGIAVDSGGNAYVTGSTTSSNFPTASPFQATCGGCSQQPNAFVSKLNASGSALVYSTYLGGSGNGTDGDFGTGIAVDSTGNAYVTGLTSSMNFPFASPIQSSSLVVQTCLDYYYGEVPCGNTAFVTQLNPAGSTLSYSTYLGAKGGNFEEGFGIAVDNNGNAYVTGRATSNFLVTPGAFQPSPGGRDDAFVAKISPINAPGFSLSSFSLSFPDEGIGGTTAPQQITLANTGSATLTIASIASSAPDFPEMNSCDGSLPGGKNCTVTVTFAPMVAGGRTGTITITDSVASSPQKINLTGNGVAGLAATLSPASLSFGNQTQGTTSATQTVSFKNTGSAPLTVNGFSVTGANPTSFIISKATCQQNQSLAVGDSCPFSMVFSPVAIGSLSATLQILDNSAQSPRSVPLSGVGVAPPTVMLSVKSLSFAAQPVGGVSSGQSITLTTSGTGVLGNISISASTSDFRTSDTCGSSVAGGGSCTITVTFTPTAVGSKTGTLVIVDNATDSPQMVSLSGTGTDFSISPSTGSSSSATVSAGEPATYTVSVAGTTSDFSGTVSFICSDPAPQSTCSVSPNSLTVNGTTAASVTVMVTTTARSAAPARWRPRIVTPGLRVGLPWLLLFLSLVILRMALRRRSRRRAWLGLAAMLMAAALFLGCGGVTNTNTQQAQQGTTAGTYLITATAMSGGASRTSTLSLTVK